MENPGLQGTRPSEAALDFAIGAEGKTHGTPAQLGRTDQLIYDRRVEIDGVALTLDIPSVKLILTRPVGEGHRWMRTPDMDDEHLLVKVMERGLASVAAENDLSPHEAASLTRLTGELTEMLAGAG